MSVNGKLAQSAGLAGRWCLLNTGGCGIECYQRPCQAGDSNEPSEMGYPFAEVCRTENEVVLIMEDDPDLRDELVESVRSFGYAVRVPTSPSQLRQYLETFETGCVLLDIMLPDIDGTEIQKWINAADVAAPIIFISGVSDVDTVVHCMKAGAFEYLHKPFNLIALRRAVNSAVALSRQQYCERESKKFVRSVLQTLTPTELQVAHFIAQGYPTKGIAAEMGRSDNTTKIHRHKIFEKLRVNSAASVANLIAYAK